MPFLWYREPSDPAAGTIHPRMPFLFVPAGWSDYEELPIVSYKEP